MKKQKLSENPVKYFGDFFSPKISFNKNQELLYNNQ